MRASVQWLPAYNPVPLSPTPQALAWGGKRNVNLVTGSSPLCFRVQENHFWGPSLGLLMDGAVRAAFRLPVLCSTSLNFSNGLIIYVLYMTWEEKELLICQKAKCWIYLGTFPILQLDILREWGHGPLPKASRWAAKHLLLIKKSPRLLPAFLTLLWCL